MKRIVLGTVDVEQQPFVKTPVSVVEMLYTWCRIGNPQTGIADYEEHENRLFVMRKLREAREKKSEVIDFTDTEHTALKRAVDGPGAATLIADEGLLEIKRRVREATVPPA